MTNKKFKKAAMALALTACVAATPLAANAETPENAADVQAPAAVDHTEADTQEAPEAELPVEEEPEAQPAAEAAAQPAAPEATPIAVELPTAEETPEEKEETPVEVTPTEDAVVEKVAPAKVAPAPAKADVDNLIEDPDADILIEDPDADIATMDGAENAVSEDAATITGGNSYSTLDDALKDANAGDEVVLQKDHTGNITIAKWIKLNLNKHKIEGNVDVDLSKKQGDTATSQDGETTVDKKVEIYDGKITGAEDSGVTIKDAGETNVLLKDLTIEDNTGKKGGGVHIENSQNVTIDHCTIQNNKTTEVSPNTNASVDIGAGGGVFVSDKSHVTIQNGSTIQGNTGTRGGGIYTEHSTVEVKDSKIDGNTADDAPEKAPNSNKGLGGGIYSYESTLTVTDSTISGNEAKGSTSLIWYNSKDEISSESLGNGGGGICAVGKKSDVTLDGVTVTGNKATSNASAHLGSGGGIEAQGGTLTVKNSTISNNEARGNGGGIFSAEGNVLDVSGSTIQGNNSHNGGGICTGEKRNELCETIITDTKILDNTANSGLGGGIYVGTQNLTITGSKVSGNKATGAGSQGGGIVSYGSKDITLDNTIVTDNTADTGAGLYCLSTNGTHIVLKNNTHIDANIANAGGGGLYLYSLRKDAPIHLDLLDSFICKNKANKANACGGGVFAYDGAVITAKNSSISNNCAAANGGGLYLLNNSGTILADLQNAFIENNSAAGWAGGVFAYNGVTLKANNTSVSNNNASNAGGILVWNNSSAELVNSKINGNTATSDGGGVYAINGAVTVTDSDISGNTAGTNGGGLNMSASALTAKRNTIANNEAKSGGGIYLNVSSADLEGNTITENKATNGSGGGVYSYDATGEEKVALTLKNNTITKNEASSTGGGLAITNKNQTISLDGDIIEENTSKSYGGGIHMGSDSTMTMTGGSISKNHSDKLGGGIYGASRKKITLNGTKVQSNTANSGAGIYLYSKTELEAGEGTVISDNKANISGGGIFNSGSILTLKNGSVLENNTAGKFGGGLYNTGTTTVESGATLMNNTAEEYGGGLYNKGEAIVESGAKLYNNHAAQAGDDIYLVGKNSTLTLTKVGDDWMLDDCGHKINGWFADLLDARWDADGKQEHVINLKDYAADGLTIVENEDGSYTITILDENTTLALKAAHNVTPKPTPEPDPEPTPTPGPVTPETPENPPVEDATPDEAETPVTPENPANPPVQDATPDTVAALPKTGVNWFTALAMALSGMALTVAGAFTSLFAKSKH